MARHLSPSYLESFQFVAMAASRGVAGAEAEGDGAQPTPRPSTVLPLPLNHSDSQVLGYSSFPPSSPSEPPDIRNWFSSYEYDSPDLSSLPFELGSCVGGARLSAGFGKIQELRRGEHAWCTRERSCSQSPERPTKPPRLEHLPISKGKDEVFRRFKVERFVGERSNNNQIQIQIQQGGSSANGGYVAMEGDQRAQNGSEGFGISEHDDGDEDSGLPQIMEIRLRHHEQSEKIISVDSPHERESLDGRNPGRSDLLSLGTYDSEVTHETCPKKESLQGGRCRQQGEHAIEDGLIPMPRRENPQESAGGSWVSTRDYRRPSGSDENLRNGNSILENRKQPRVEGHVAIATRTALADRTNHPNEPLGGARAPEIAGGKWQCPRKNKAERGPPLKQLRLECWVRRVI